MQIELEVQQLIDESTQIKYQKSTILHFTNIIRFFYFYFIKFKLLKIKYCTVLCPACHLKYSDYQAYSLWVIDLFTLL